MIVNSFRFSRKEHLKSPKQIALLFKKGSSLNAFPFRFQYLLSEKSIEMDDEDLMKVAFTVPKRKFRKAVDRNRIKRQMIEIFRLNREELVLAVNNKKIHLDLMIVYNGDRLPEYEKIEKRMKSGISKLCGKL